MAHSRHFRLHQHLRRFRMFLRKFVLSTIFFVQTTKSGLDGLCGRGVAVIFNRKTNIMKNFRKYSVLLMTAAMACGMLTSCQDKKDTESEEEPITIRKVWLMEYIDEDTGKKYGYIGHDFGMIDGTYHLIDGYEESEEFVERMNKIYDGLELSMYEIPYMSIGENANLEIVETDATSGTITVGSNGENLFVQYKNLTRDSVIMILEQDGETTPEIEFRTPEGWGLTVTRYVDITSYEFGSSDEK